MKKLTGKQKITILILAVLIVILGGIFILPAEIWQMNPAGETGQLPQIQGEKVSLTINDGTGNPKIFLADFEEKMTAFDLLKEEAEKSGLFLKTKSYDIGIMIETIGDKTNGEENKYWLYYVNGQMPPLAADKEELKAGDKVEFKFANSPF